MKKQNLSTVAIIEDNKLMSHLLVKTINDFENYRVLFCVSNGKEFIRKAHRRCPDMVILDIAMTEMNGYQTTEWIVSNLPDCKILVLSTINNLHAKVKMIHLGINGFLLRSSAPEELARALDSIRTTGYYLNDTLNEALVYYYKNYKLKTGALTHFAPFSRNENIYLKMACSRLTHDEIAGMLYVSPRTIDTYRSSVYAKTGVKNRAQLIVYAIANGLVHIQDLCKY